MRRISRQLTVSEKYQVESTGLLAVFPWRLPTAGVAESAVFMYCSHRAA